MKVSRRLAGRRGVVDLPGRFDLGMRTSVRIALQPARHSRLLFADNCKMHTMGTRLKNERERRNLTQRELARKAGVSPTTVADIESGRSHATTKLINIAKALNVDPQWLGTGKGQREQAPSPDNTYIAAESLEDLALKLLDKGNDDIAKLWQLILSLKDASK